MGTLPLGAQLQRIGGSLTPQRLSSILSSADAGIMYELIDLENEARQKDCHLQAILGTRELAVAGLEWEVVAPEGSGARDKKAAEFVADVLRSLDGFPTLLSHMQGAVYHGYAVAEGRWERIGGDVIPTAYTMIPARRFAFGEQDQKLHWWDANGGPAANQNAGSRGRPGVPMDSFPRGQFIVHQPRINGDVPGREGLGRVLMWASLMRNWGIRDWLSLAELAWKPWRTGSYLKNASTEDVDILVQILRQMSASGIAVYPETTKLDIHWPEAKTGTGSNHGELVRFLAEEMSKATLGQTLTTEQGRVGSNALGNVHNQVRKDIRENDALADAATIRRDMITPLVQFNYSAQVRVPILRFLTEDSPDLKMMATVCKTVSALMPVPQSWARDQLGIPEPVGDEPILAGWVEVDTSELDEPEEPDTDEEPA